MNNMNDRIKEIRKSEGLTQVEFAKRIGLSRNYIGLIEIGKRAPSDRTIFDICRVFSVNEKWLRTGEGEMFTGRKKEMFDFFTSTFGGLTDQQTKVISIMARLTDEQLEIIQNMANEMFDELEN